MVLSRWVKKGRFRVGRFHWIEGKKVGRFKLRAMVAVKAKAKWHKAVKARVKKLEAARIKRMIAFLSPQEKIIELKCVGLHTSERKKVWCIDWNPNPTLVPTDQLAQSSQSYFPSKIKKWALASCGEDGLNLWTEHELIAGYMGGQNIWSEHEHFAGYTYTKEEKWLGTFRSCLWHPRGHMIAGGTIAGIEKPEGYVFIWNCIDGNWNEHSQICIEGSSADVVDLSWIENKLLCCTADGHFCVIEVEMSGGHHVLATHHDNTNAEINFVKWHCNSNYFICGGHRGLEVYRFFKTPEEWAIEKAAIRTSTTAAAGICFVPGNYDGSEFVVFKFAGGIKTWKLNITKDFMGHDLVSLNFINIHGRRLKFGTNITTSTSTYFSFDLNRISTEDRYMVLGREDGRIEIYACDEGYPDDDYHSIGEYAAHMDIISCVKWSPWTKGILVSGSLDGTIKFWKMDDVTDYDCL